MELQVSHFCSPLVHESGTYTCWYYAKKKTFRASERDRPDVIEKEMNFIRHISTILPEDLVFLDETGTNLNMTRLFARSQIGTRACCKRTSGRASNISIIGAISLAGVEALYPFDGPIDGERFLFFLDEKLLPNLERGQTLVMDNLRVHHIQAVKERCAKAGVGLIYLPPYSPERNPIEEAWSVVKGVFRRLEARTIVEYINTLQAAKEALTVDKIKGFFRHANYAQLR